MADDPAASSEVNTTPESLASMADDPAASSEVDTTPIEYLENEAGSKGLQQRCDVPQKVSEPSKIKI